MNLLLNYLSPEKIKLFDFVIQGVLEDCEIASNSLNPSLLSGNSGYLILLALKYQNENEKYKIQFEKEILNFKHNLDQYNDSTLSNGLTGALYTLLCIKKITNTSIISIEEITEVEENILLTIDTYIEDKNWDPLHGLIGVGSYFLFKHNFFLNCEDKLKLITTKIIELSTDYEYSKVWITQGYKNGLSQNINFGMAHGLPGILSFLCKIAKNNILYKEILSIVESSLLFIENNSFENEKEIFPSCITIDNKEKLHSRLAWCYGDLCVANLYMNAYNTFSIYNWKNRSIEIVLNTLNRNIESLGINDAGFCHGTSGLIHQYYKYFKITYNKDIANRIIELINFQFINYYSIFEGIGGFQSKIYDRNSNKFIHRDDAGLINGSSGIALVLFNLLYYSNNQNNEWESIFYTDIC